MDFNEFVTKNFTAENYDIQPYDAAELAWNACKEEVLSILSNYPAINGEIQDTIYNLEFKVKEL